MKGRPVGSSVEITGTIGNIVGNVIAGRDVRAQRIAAGAGAGAAGESVAVPNVRQLLDEIESDLHGLASHQSELRTISPDAGHQVQAVISLIAAMRESLAGDRPTKADLVGNAQSAAGIVVRMLQKGQALVTDAAKMGGSLADVIQSLETVGGKVGKLAKWITLLWP